MASDFLPDQENGMRGKGENDPGPWRAQVEKRPQDQDRRVAPRANDAGVLVWIVGQANFSRTKRNATERLAGVIRQGAAPSTAASKAGGDDWQASGCLIASRLICMCR